MAQILVAEDEAALRGHILRALAACGHDAVAVGDGGEALDALLAEKGRFDLLLADIKMPVMDGIALALAAAREDPALAILLMTGFADQRERASGLDALIQGLLTKPFSVADLHREIAAAMATKGRGRLNRPTEIP
jgi:two-component system cell cycle response regulator CpdR